MAEQIVTAEARGLSLWEIEKGIGLCAADLEYAQDKYAENPSEETRYALQVAHESLNAYVREEIRKVDGIAGYIRHCEACAATASEEALRVRATAKRWGDRAEAIKDAALSALRAIGTKRVESALNKLSRRGNGGAQPLIIAQPEIIPDAYRIARVEMPLPLWKHLVKVVEELQAEAIMLSSEPDTDMIRAALSRGEGVPGCRLEERGEHLRLS